jgi:hypothetical protein
MCYADHLGFGSELSNSALVSCSVSSSCMVLGAGVGCFHVVGDDPSDWAVRLLLLLLLLWGTEVGCGPHAAARPLTGMAGSFTLFCIWALVCVSTAVLAVLLAVDLVLGAGAVSWDPVLKDYPSGPGSPTAAAGGLK